ncbi:hypothetical protein G6F47_004463 [Rhizopus delemar]|uniref:Long-chain-fatty-acid--CoA ligase n=1 Tax=Rhizopus delemar (strain RA 99-880 / ATCC MYA-4621 / FGSC 9543 / NRRL 43880) TaxID=246409 RepID=I1CME7_RHIO9|nr:hypothetical protein RO3G_14338 [Rhizopus delemar RA 99-880]KAG1498992.1 hypothetical protein G6F54_004695 [Rhizopus delemar]KAG1512735.1 hypothetical protein G6F53_004956 [Rhizopus delemar]KAG1600581.1 hypothetical protein G6F47_004463 [Rhizopus delemar]|eukprot:EIE89627.1 hypothetical protein RO3G_14338 [Rhizopus delemar RA 99-880]
MTKVGLDKQSYEVPNTRKSGQTGVYRNAKRPVVEETFSPKVTTMIECFNHGLKLSKDRPCVGIRTVKNVETGERGPYVWLTYRKVNHRLTNFGSGILNYLNHTMNDTRTRQIPIGIWSVNRPEWTIADLALSAYSLYTIALYDTLGPDTVEFVINHAEIETVICSGDHIADLLKIKHKLPKLKTIISMDRINEISQQGVASKTEIIKAWAAEKDINLIDFETVELLGKKNRRSYNYPAPDDLACIMYTSGTTGMPKGAMLTHRNFVSALAATYTSVGGTTDDICISYLPLAHIFGRISDALVLTLGGRIGFFSGDMNTLVEDIQVLKPTVFPSVPRLLNKIYGKLLASTVQAPGVTGALARRAVNAKLSNLEAGKGFTHPLWDRLIFNKVKQVLGGNVRIIVTGSAPIGQDVIQFLRVAFCCEIREGYGATETCATTTIHYENESMAGHVGGPFPCNEIKLVDVPEMNYLSTDPCPRGEICVRGPNIFKGYYKDEEKTRECIDEEGWFHTGDIGMINETGAFVIIDRIKNIFKLAQGEYIAPEKIENVYSKDPLIGQIYLHGDSLQSSLVAIIVPDSDALNALIAARLPHVSAKKLSYIELCKLPEVNELVLAQMNHTGKKAKLRGFEFAKAIYLESEAFSIENDLLTPTFKVKRSHAKKKFEAQIAKLYEHINSQVGSEKSKL